jgi:hypothetical protein
MIVAKSVIWPSRRCAMARSMFVLFGTVLGAALGAGSYLLLSVLAGHSFAYGEGGVLASDVLFSPLLAGCFGAVLGAVTGWAAAKNGLYVPRR